MKTLKKTINVCLALLVCLSLSANFTAYSQTTEKKTVEKKAEHPEHPAEHPAEHPEHPEKATAHKLTVQELSYAVKKYVSEESSKNNGYFMVKDNKDGDLKLKLTKIHDEKLTSLSNTLHFVCADFSADLVAGTSAPLVYDLDIFMEGTDKDNLKTTEVKVHKKNGTPRYTWFEENGVWKTKEGTVGTAPEKKAGSTVAPAPEKKKSEHPEHPKN